MNRLKLVLPVLVCLLLVSAAAHAQGSIAGVVRDSSGAVLPGVTVDASSPALIEKVRSVVTDGTGQYKIIDLRPGTYTIVFTLTGFSVLTRQGIELTGSFAATVNADLMVGTVAEALTVTAEAPTVDIQSTRKSNVIPAEVIDALPAARSQYLLTALLPGAIKGGGVQDVGGTRTMLITTFSIHGNRRTDQRLMVNGLTTRNLHAAAFASNYVPDMGTSAEVVIDYSSGTADSQAGGLIMNIIPREGGNRFTSSLFATAANGSFQGNNYSDELKNAGLSTPNKLHRLYDINPTIGGPVLQDRLWFFGSMRWQESSTYVAGAFANKNGGDLTKWTYEADPTKPGESSLTMNPTGSVRLTWQATPRNKIGFSADPQARHQINGLPANFSPEIYINYDYYHNSFTTGSWSAPLTSRLLVDARFSNAALGFMDRYPEPDDPYRRAIPVLEQSTGFLYRGKGYATIATPVYFEWVHAPYIMQAQASLSYVTGSHALKIGFQDDFGPTTVTSRDNEYGLYYQFLNGTPVSLEQHALPLAASMRLSADAGVYAQDKWTFKRATVNAGIRFDYFRSKFPEQHLGPASFVPNRNITIPERPYNNLKDVTPRVGVAYDLFGDGKTALKTSWGKYMIGLNASLGNPVYNLSYISRRSWTPSLPSGDPNYYTPQCDLTNPAKNGDCGALGDARFGQLIPSAAVDPETYTGWGHRPWNQEFSASVQRQIVSRVAVDVGYFRRWYGNFTVVDNRAVSAADFTRYSITAPVDPRLATSGQVIGGLYELNPNKVGQVDNLTTFADAYGTQDSEHWNGVDLTVNARPRNGFVLQGGLSSGRTSTDNCDLRRTLPEISVIGTNAVPEGYCHVDTKFLTQLKFLGAYLVPKLDVQFGVTFQSTPGPEIASNYFVSSALTQPQVPLTGGFRLVNLVAPGNQYVTAIKQLDVRFSKLFRRGRTRTAVNLDLANALNSNDRLGINATYGSRWLAPVSIMDARLVKISAQFDF